MKVLRSILTVCLLACLLAGCAVKVPATVCVIRATGLEEKQVSIRTLAPENLVIALSDEGILPQNITVKAFSQEGNALFLDLNEAILPHLSQYQPVGQRMIMQCVANTFLQNYQAQVITIRCNGLAITDDLADFTAPLVYDLMAGVDPLTTPTPEPTPSPTPTPTPTIEPTPGDQPVLTPGQQGETNIIVPKGSATPQPGKQLEEGKKYVALTFDDGPHYKYTRMFVDKLKEFNAHATFFIVGNRVDNSTADAMRYAVENGNEIQIHGYTHAEGVYYHSCSDERYAYELNETAKVITATVGIAPTLMRPFGGSISKARIASCPYSVIIWDVDTEDWKYKSKGESGRETIINNAMKNVRDRSIILMHEIYENSYLSFCTIIEQLYAQGYEVVSVSELLGMNAKPGTRYYAGY